MFAIFVITLFGCSDSMSQCDVVQKVSLHAATKQECMVVAQQMMTTTRVDYPSTAADCAAGSDAKTPMAIASSADTDHGSAYRPRLGD